VISVLIFSMSSSFPQSPATSWRVGYVFHPHAIMSVRIDQCPNGIQLLSDHLVS
jgi:hypothetical protein